MLCIAVFTYAFPPNLSMTAYEVLCSVSHDRVIAISMHGLRMKLQASEIT